MTTPQPEPETALALALRQAKDRPLPRSASHARQIAKAVAAREEIGRRLAEPIGLDPAEAPQPPTPATAPELEAAAADQPAPRLLGARQEADWPSPPSATIPLRIGGLEAFQARLEGQLELQAASAENGDRIAYVPGLPELRVSPKLPITDARMARLAVCAALAMPFADERFLGLRDSGQGLVVGWCGEPEPAVRAALEGLWRSLAAATPAVEWR